MLSSPACASAFRASTHGGGYGHADTFLEYSKVLIDSLYGWYGERCPELRPDPVTKSTFALHFYDSILAVEKRPMRPPESSKTGKPAF